jgi:hypothetical protein
MGLIRRFLWKWNTYFPLHRRWRFSLSQRRRKLEKKWRRKEVIGVTGRGLGTTDASDQWQQLCAAQGARVCNWRVWSLVKPEHPVTHPGNSSCLRADRTWWRVRLRAIGRVWSTKSLSRTSLDSDRTLALSCPVVVWSVFHRMVSNANQWRPDA